ncbi:hypothetical protein YC2023_067498 [Brassica napus]
MAARIEKLLRDVDGLYWIRAHWYTPKRCPPVQLSPKYPDPPPSAPTTTATDDPTAAFREQPKKLRADFVKAAKQFDALVASLPLSDGGEESQLRIIAEFQII